MRCARDDNGKCRFPEEKLSAETTALTLIDGLLDSSRGSKDEGIPVNAREANNISK